MGLAVRGLILCMVGYFFLQSAITYDPNKAIGPHEALSKLAGQPYGQGILGLTAFGLILYGVFEMMKGKYQHMGPGSY
ncbi:MAG TPA: DUF1206 domain-containing protein [Bacillus sp. (in: firmicutes)]|nr:DUF1206 domain-containing protein [Bacillus sp. (in: firmicutes)]